MNNGPVYSSERSAGWRALRRLQSALVEGLEVEEIETIEAADLIQPYPSADGLVVVELDVEHIELSLAQANGWGSAGECPARHCAKPRQCRSGSSALRQARPGLRPRDCTRGQVGVV